MKILLRVLMSFVLLLPVVSLLLPNAEAADNTFVDIKKITTDMEISTLNVYEDQLIMSHRYSGRDNVVISSYSKGGTKNWEKSASGPYAITETKFTTIDRNHDVFKIHSTVTGEVLHTGNFPKFFEFDTISRMYMNEKYIVLAKSPPNASSFYVYDTTGKFVINIRNEGFYGAALSKDTLIYQDSKGVHAVDLLSREKIWHVPLETRSNNERLLMPKDNVAYAQGVERLSQTDATPTKDVVTAINVTTGAVLYKKDFGKYEETWARVKDFGFFISHPYEDIHRIYHPDGNLKLELNMESEAIKQLKQKYFVYGIYYNGAEDYVASKQGIYYFKTYDAVHEEFLFSSLKILDNKGTVKFEKVIENEYIFGIATTDSDKLFVARGNALGISSETNYLDVYDSSGKLLDTIETGYIDHLKSEGSTLYGYGGNELYIFKESDPMVETILSNKVTHHSTRVIGAAEAGSKITIEAGTTVIGTAMADATGKFAVPIAKQKIGTGLSIVAIDAAGNSSAPILVTVVDGNYPDLKAGHWAFDKIMYLADDKIIMGYTNGTFMPEKKTTRAEAAKMLAIALDLPIQNVSSGFKDVSSKHWAKNYIAAVSKAGLFVGNPDGTFAPDATLKRGEMAKVISIAYELKASENHYFKDVMFGYWARGYISGLYENGITKGYPDKTFRPAESTTRAEFSVFLAKALNKDFR